ncbi:MAG TPA: SRPBCC domain-containing protein [Candidatus Eisenbacteria bacterium]|nr:SRPBCC domain-containing protein [Candidatus Eisenbacteria bacterium]
MPVKKDASGRRSVAVETEVPGTPEEVWQAIATGPGISAWFVPTQLEGREGGAITLDFGPGMESKAVITAWDPGRRFVAESKEQMGPGSPTVADEWTVEAKSGGTCRVRIVHSWFASTDDWDNQFEGVEKGWPAFFRILGIYLAHFRGQPSGVIPLLAMGPGSKSAAWDRLLGSLGFARLAEGQRVKAAAGAPRLAGIVDRVGDQEHEELFIRLEEPTSGVAHFLPIVMGGQVCLSVRLYLYGAQAKAAAARETPAWEAWINKLLPAAESEATKA